MSQILLLSNINFRAIQSSISSTLKRIDWKVGAVATLALATVAYLARSYLFSKPSLARPTFKSLDNIDAEKLGFSKEQRTKLKSVGGFMTLFDGSPGEEVTTSYTFEMVCNRIIYEIHFPGTENVSFEAPLSKKSWRTFNFIDFGIHRDVPYEQASDVERRESWFYMTLKALRDQGYITFVINPTSIEITRCLPQPYQPPKTPLLYLTPQKLGFANHQLNQSEILPNTDGTRYTFRELCEEIINTIRLESLENIVIQENSIIFDCRNFGLSPGRQVQVPWVYQILTALKNKGYITTFDMNRTNIEITKIHPS